MEVKLNHAAADVGGGSGHPEALQRLIEMELRNASANQMNQAASAGGREIHFSQGIYGPKAGFGFPI